MDNQVLKKQIKFKFRRGLKETDMLFEKFSNAHFDSLSDDELVELNLLLDKSDQNLLGLFFERKLTNPTDLETKILNSWIR